MKRLRVNFCGAPSTYKTTVCTGLESKLKQNKIEAETSKEYARHYIATYGLPVELYEQFIIMNNQEIRDNSVSDTNQVMLSDTPCTSNYVFGKRMLDNKLQKENRSQPSKAEYKFLEELYMTSLKKTNWFDIIFVFPPSGQIVQDGVRVESVKDQMDIYEAIIGFLKLNNVKYYEVPGEVEERIQYCYEVIVGELKENKNNQFSGVIYSLDYEEKYGHIRQENGELIFFEIEESDYRKLTFQVGDKVCFDIKIHDNNPPEACNVKPIN